MAVIVLCLVCLCGFVGQPASAAVATPADLAPHLTPNLSPRMRAALDSPIWIPLNQATHWDGMMGTLAKGLSAQERLKPADADAYALALTVSENQHLYSDVRDPLRGSGCVDQLDALLTLSKFGGTQFAHELASRHAAIAQAWNQESPDGMRDVSGLFFDNSADGYRHRDHAQLTEFRPPILKPFPKEEDLGRRQLKDVRKIILTALPYVQGLSYSPRLFLKRRSIGNRYGGLPATLSFENLTTGKSERLKTARATVLHEWGHDVFGQTMKKRVETEFEEAAPSMREYRTVQTETALLDPFDQQRAERETALAKRSLAVMDRLRKWSIDHFGNRSFYSSLVNCDGTVGPFNELFADLVSVLVLADLDAMSKTGLSKPTSRSFDGFLEAESWTEKEEHYFFAPVRKWIGAWIKKRGFPDPETSSAMLRALHDLAFEFVIRGQVNHRQVGKTNLLVIKRLEEMFDSIGAAPPRRLFSSL